jgi:hypothetical protein
MPASGVPYRADGKPLTDSDLASVYRDWDVEKMQWLADRYEARFGNVDEITHLSFITNPAFLHLLNVAVDQGQPLTRNQVEEIFPDVGWDW